MQSQESNIKNLLTAIVLSTLVLLGWQVWVEGPKREAAQKAAAEQQAAEAARAAIAPLPQPELSTASTKPDEGVNQAKASIEAEAPRVRIESPWVHGSISLRGLRFDDITLANYREQLDPESPEVRLLSPSNTPQPYFAEFGWLSHQGIQTPTPETLWQADGDKLKPGKPLTFTWTNNTGQIFTIRIALDEDYLFTVTQTIRNDSQASATVSNYGLVNRTFADTGKHFFILHEGPLGVLGGELHEESYESLREKGKINVPNTDGWFGITDKYWLAAIIPDAKTKFAATAQYVAHSSGDRYQVDYLGPQTEIKPGESAESTVRFFAGAKKVSLLDSYAKQYAIPLFDRAVDFGWFYFLTKPIFYVLSQFYQWVGNFGIAIMLLTVLIKLIMFPLANKSYAAMSQMKLLMPKIEEIRKRYEDDKLKMNQEIMALYRAEKVNPMSGCLPILIQLPVFFALYKVLFVTIEMRHAPFFGWIHDLSAPDPTNLFTVFGLLDWNAPAFLHIGVWPIIMCITMVLQQRLNPKPSDPVQAQVLAWMPYVFLFLFASFPAGLVIYWAWSNTLSICQQWFITRRYTRRKEAKAA